MANREEITAKATKLRDDLISRGVSQDRVDEAVSKFVSKAVKTTPAPAQNPMEFVNLGISRGLGSAVDLANLAPMALNLIPGVEGFGPFSDEPVLGSKNIQRGMRAAFGDIVSEREPETIGEKALTGLGEVAGLGVPAGGRS